MNGNDSACIANIAVMLAPIRSFRVRVLSAVSQILPRPTPVAMATRCETKTAMIRIVYEISPRSLRLTRMGSGYPSHLHEIERIFAGIWDRIMRKE